VQSSEGKIIFRRNNLSLSSGMKNKPSKTPALYRQIAVPQKRRLNFTGLYGVISQKIELFVTVNNSL
jgi:hypothetical protein